MNHPAIDVLLNHRTIRRFKPEPVSERMLDVILAAGTRAATPAEMQFYSFILIDDAATLTALDVRSPVAIVACIDLLRHNRWMAMHDAAPLRGDAPDLLFCFWDIALTIQSMVLAAESLGLGTLTVVRKMHGMFDLPEGVYPACLLAVGHPDEDPSLRGRFPLEAIVHGGTYRVPTDDEIATWYEPMDRKWERSPRAALLALGNKTCTNFAQVLSALLERETGWIGENLRGTGFAVERET